MSSRFLRLLVIGFAAFGMTITAFFCRERAEPVAGDGPRSPWRNVYDTSVRYVGMNTCRTCHASVYDSYIQTGMGQSFDHASRQKSAADFTPAHALVYDKDKDLYYKPYFAGDSLYIMEYRLEGRDTVHKRVEQVHYIIGSGQHTNSHIYNSGGYLYQAPITFYTQKGRWDLAPGFERGGNLRFSRLIELECMSCHNGLPEFEPASQNKYISVRNGIDCERCHGPGSLHVAEKSAGKIVDTSKGPDYSIVNPRRLPTELQNNVCQRCHLQGISVLNEGKSFADFRPGMELSEMENVFMPQYAGAEDKMIMASHVERMKKSPCYLESKRMSCITCHNPHVSVKQTPRAQYLNACGSCHGAPDQVHCSEKESLRQAKGNDCVTCHMPQNGSIDIPHVAITDHFIRKRPLPHGEKTAITAFLGLQCFNNDHVDAITTARAYLEFFEKLNPSRPFIDSALKYLGREGAAEAGARQNRDYIRAYFLLEDYPRVLQYAAGLKPGAVTDAWTCYRIGEANFQAGQAPAALPWYERAVQLLPYALDFQNKLGVCHLRLNNLDAAEKRFAFILKENPKFGAAAGHLGFIYMQRGQPTMAYEYLMRALALDPDHEQTLINLAVWLHQSNDLPRCRQVLVRVLKRNPQHAQAAAMLADLNRMTQ